MGRIHLDLIEKRDRLYTEGLEKFDTAQEERAEVGYLIKDIKKGDEVAEKLLCYICSSGKIPPIPPRPISRIKLLMTG